MPIYMPPSLRRFDAKRMVFSTWVDHMPFGYDIIAAQRPRLLVELGTFSGLSFFTFCQSMKEHDIEGVCYAVDSWQGDVHTEPYDESVFDDVQKHARQHYRGFTYLMKMMFSEALQHFDDNSIDLIHIDGLHTYEAVSADFEQWYPKVAPGGLMLLHDVRARLKDFGVWKFWEETAPRYQTFTFDHGFGLGVLRKEGGGDPVHPLLQLLFDGDPGTATSLREMYVHASEFLEARRQLSQRRRSSDKAG